MAKRGPHPKNPCPKCSGRMIRETVGGRSYMECHNIDCGGRVLLDQKAPTEELYQFPEQPEKRVRRGPRGPNRTPMSEESRRKIGEAMRAAHARRKGLPAPAPRTPDQTVTSIIPTIALESLRTHAVTPPREKGRVHHSIERALQELQTQEAELVDRLVPIREKIQALTAARTILEEINAA